MADPGANSTRRGKVFAEKYMKLKEIGQGWGRVN